MIASDNIRVYIEIACFLENQEVDINFLVASINGDFPLARPFFLSTALLLAAGQKSAALEFIGSLERAASEHGHCGCLALDTTDLGQEVGSPEHRIGTVHSRILDDTGNEYPEAFRLHEVYCNFDILVLLTYTLQDITILLGEISFRNLDLAFLWIPTFF
ncbi:MAG: hypothetical protein J7M24_01755, partial [Candidatus Latescibacteria bacterium]|nr:hypothetical protein [Candidatus Latescibacterota bacterium]